MFKTLKKSVLIGGALGVGLLAANTATARASTINGAGATFPYPIYSKWFQAYSGVNSSTTFNYQPVGSGAGYSQYKAGTVFFGATDAPLSNAELAAVPGTAHIPTVAGAIVLAYNVPGIGPGLRLSGDVIADIYLGKIKNWNDPRIQKLNPSLSLPARNITVAHRADGSGTTYIFTHYLAAISPAWKSKVGAGKSVSWPVGLGGNGNPGVAGLVKSSPGTIGYVELAYAVQNRLNYGPVRNRAGNFVLANTASTQEAANQGAARMAKDVRVSVVNGGGVNTYPIVGFTYLLVPKTSKDAARSREMVSFLRWAMGPGQGMAESLLYAPLPKSVVQINERAIAGIRAGR
jgi:phosphate transport system substrate-binding protein